MCGLAGFLNLDGAPASAAIVDRMSGAVRHRGPDGDGHLVDGAVALGHRRLAVLDLTPAGHQPMITPDRRFAMVFNGEVYNHAEIRAELEALAHRFHSRTDSEVVLHALAQWGHSALARLNGMFALALWDSVERSLLLARDRYGIKPLYYVERPGELIFASEVKALLIHPSVESRVDTEGLAEYLTFQNFLGPRTLFEGIKLLPAGTALTVESRTGRLRSWRYWDFSFSEPANPAQPAEYLEELQRLFEQAVSRQLVSDVPIGGYLSGGVDTGAIVAVASSQLEGMRTFTVGFDTTSASGLELGADERPEAEFMSYLCGTEHYEMVLKAGDMERAMTPLMAAVEEPRVGQSYPNYYAAKLARAFDKVVLAGTGGDELFAGYPWRYMRAAGSPDFESFVDSYLDFWQRLMTPDEARTLFRNGTGYADFDARTCFRDVFAAGSQDVGSPADVVNRSLYFEAKTFLHGLLVVEDKLSMAFGLESRVPFLDNDLVDFAQRVPVALKLGDLAAQPAVARLDENAPGRKTEVFFDRSKLGKLILRDTLRRYVPDEVARLAKRGFSGPDEAWYRGESIDYVRRTLMGSDARLFSLLERSEVHRLVNDHISGRRNRRLLVWSLLCLETWLHVFA